MHDCNSPKATCSASKNARRKRVARKEVVRKKARRRAKPKRPKLHDVGHVDEIEPLRQIRDRLQGSFSLADAVYVKAEDIIDLTRNKTDALRDEFIGPVNSLAIDIQAALEEMQAAIEELLDTVETRYDNAVNKLAGRI